MPTRTGSEEVPAFVSKATKMLIEAEQVGTGVLAARSNRLSGVEEPEAAGAETEALEYGLTGFRGCGSVALSAHS